jgi:AraC-like DNA-binding protein
MRHHMRSASLTGYPELARSLGLDPAGLMSRVGLDIRQLEAADSWLPGAPVARLLELSARESGRSDFGLLMTDHRGVAAPDPFGVVLSQEPDLRSALDLLVDYQDVYTGVLDLRVIETSEWVTVQVGLSFGEPVPHRQALDYAVAGHTDAIGRLLGADWQPAGASFAYEPPADLGTYRRIFGPGLRFRQEFTGLVLPASDLDRAIVSSDPALRPYTRQFLQSVAIPKPRPPADEVSTLVAMLLPSGRALATEVSRLLGVTPRTLHRRLARQGDSFSEILHDLRARLAERYLADRRYSLTDVSGLLGFEAPSAFSRWFRQRFGVSPTEWRRSSGPAG